MSLNLIFSIHERNIDKIKLSLNLQNHNSATYDAAFCGKAEMDSVNSSKYEFNNAALSAIEAEGSKKTDLGLEVGAPALGLDFENILGGLSTGFLRIPGKFGSLTGRESTAKHEVYRISKYQ